MPTKRDPTPPVPNTSLPPDLSQLDEDLPEADVYAVGYGKPPRHTRFKPGHRGGPGRPRGSKNRETIFHEIFDKPRPATINGARKRVSLQEVAYRELGKKAAKGDLKAIALIEQIRASIGSNATRDAVVEPLSESELAILDRRSHG